MNKINFLAGKMKDTVVILPPVEWEEKRLSTSAGIVVGGGSGGSTRAATGSSSRHKNAASIKNQSKLLLRELCVDKDYLEQLTIDPSNI